MNKEEKHEVNQFSGCYFHDRDVFMEEVRKYATPPESYYYKGKPFFTNLWVSITQ